jgi:hypothetical protein
MSDIPEGILRQAFGLVESMKSNKDDALTTSDSRYASLLADDANAIARAIMAWHEAAAARITKLDDKIGVFMEAAVERVLSLEAENARLKEAPSQAALDVLMERDRQVASEGWTAEHDDEHKDGEIAAAAATYAFAASFSEFRRKRITGINSITNSIALREMWPWAEKWWKSTDRRRDLVKAGALIIAEIERLDRAALAVKAGE